MRSVLAAGVVALSLVVGAGAAGAQSIEDILDAPLVPLKAPTASRYQVSALYDVTVKGTQAGTWHYGVTCYYIATGREDVTFRSRKPLRLRYVAEYDNPPADDPLVTVPLREADTAELDDVRAAGFKALSPTEVRPIGTATTDELPMTGQATPTNAYSTSGGCDRDVSPDVGPDSCASSGGDFTLRLLAKPGTLAATSGRYGLEMRERAPQPSGSCPYSAFNPNPTRWPDLYLIGLAEGDHYVAQGPTSRELTENPGSGKFIFRGTENERRDYLTDGIRESICPPCEETTSIEYEVTMTRVRTGRPARPAKAKARVSGRTATITARAVKGAVGYAATITAQSANAAAATPARVLRRASRRPSVSFSDLARGTYRLELSALGGNGESRPAVQTVRVR